LSSQLRRPQTQDRTCTQSAAAAAQTRPAGKESRQLHLRSRRDSRDGAQRDSRVDHPSVRNIEQGAAEENIVAEKSLPPGPPTEPPQSDRQMSRHAESRQDRQGSLGHRSAYQKMQKQEAVRRSSDKHHADGEPSDKERRGPTSIQIPCQWRYASAAEVVEPAHAGDPMPSAAGKMRSCCVWRPDNRGG